MVSDLIIYQGYAGVTSKVYLTSPELQVRRADQRARRAARTDTDARPALLRATVWAGAATGRPPLSEASLHLWS